MSVTDSQSHKRFTSRHAYVTVIKVKDLNTLHETSHSLGDNEYSMGFKTTSSSKKRLIKSNLTILTL